MASIEKHVGEGWSWDRKSDITSYTIPIKPVKPRNLHRKEKVRTHSDDDETLVEEGLGMRIGNQLSRFGNR